MLPSVHRVLGVAPQPASNANRRTTVAVRLQPSGIRNRKVSVHVIIDGRHAQLASRRFIPAAQHENSLLRTSRQSCCHSYPMAYAISWSRSTTAPGRPRPVPGNFRLDVAPIPPYQLAFPHGSTRRRRRCKSRTGHLVQRHPTALNIRAGIPCLRCTVDTADRPAATTANSAPSHTTPDSAVQCISRCGSGTTSSAGDNPGLNSCYEPYPVRLTINQRRTN